MKKPLDVTGDFPKTISCVEELKKKVKISFTDGQELFISKLSYINGYYYVGKILTKDQIEEIESYDSLTKVKSYALNILSKKDYSEKEVREKINNHFMNEYFDVDKVIAELKYEKLIDDYRLAKDLIDYYLSQGYSKEAVIDVLYKRKIGKAVISSTTSDIEIDQEATEDLMRTVFNRYQNKPFATQCEKVTNYLITKGFSYGNARQLVHEYISKHEIKDQDKENELLTKQAQVIYDKYKSRNKSGYELKSKVVNALLQKGFKYDDIISHIEGENYEFN